MNLRARRAALAAAAAAGGLLVGVALARLWDSPAVPQVLERRGVLPAAGEGADPAPSEGGSRQARPAPSAPVEGDTVEVIRSGPIPELYPMLLDSFALDLTGDGEEERVELYANVERDQRGRLMWDDGQRWMLLARAAGDARAWVLFEDFVQLGRLSFWAVQTVEPPNALIVEIAAGAGVRVWELSYDAALGGFVERASVAASGNVLHRTPNELE
jgi:hypothetical protein